MDNQLNDQKETQRESMEYDVVIIGGGPSGLSAAIRIKQLAKEKGTDLSVCVLEKGSEIGAHLLSGAVLETRALDELIPDWKDKGAPITSPVTQEKLLYLTKKHSVRLPNPPQSYGDKNYVVSLGEVGRWLAEQAEELGVEIYPGFAASEVLYNDDGSVKGVATGDTGIDKDGNKTSSYEPGMELHAKQTMFGEGCRGSLTKDLEAKFELRKDCDPQTYGLGIKEIWEVDPKHHKEGLILHSIGWPLKNDTYGGSFMYHMKNNQISVGFVVGLDYSNPHLSPFDEMQRAKLHPAFRKYLEGGKRISYGARTLSEGGIQSLPKLTFPGGVLIGDTAGFLNVPKIKGTHTAMKSGMVAAESIYEHLTGENKAERECTAFTDNFKKSWLFKELDQVRNIRPAFNKGLFRGLIRATWETITFGKLSGTKRNHPDHEQLKPADKAPKIDYPKPDGKLTFDKLSSVFLANTSHDENQPCHLTLKDASVPIDINLKEYDAPEQRYCPAGVYEIIKEEKKEDEEEQKAKLQINSANCVHCKACDIKDPTQNIKWVPPQGGSGPNYSNM